jgi:hypothetical protein
MLAACAEGVAPCAEGVAPCAEGVAVRARTGARSVGAMNGLAIFIVSDRFGSLAIAMATAAAGAPATPERETEDPDRWDSIAWEPGRRLDLGRARTCRTYSCRPALWRRGGERRGAEGNDVRSCAQKDAGK